MKFGCGCGRSFQSRVGLDEHRRIVHTGVGKIMPPENISPAVNKQKKAWLNLTAEERKAKADKMTAGRMKRFAARRAAGLPAFDFKGQTLPPPLRVLPPPPDKPAPKPEPDSSLLSPFEDALAAVAIHLAKLIHVIVHNELASKALMEEILRPRPTPAPKPEPVKNISMPQPAPATKPVPRETEHVILKHAVEPEPPKITKHRPREAHRNMSVREAIALAKRLGCTVENVFRTGEIVFKHPKYRRAVRIDARRHEIPRVLTTMLVVLEKGESR